MALRFRASIVRHRFFVPVVGLLLSLAALWTFGRQRPDIERVRRQFAALQQQRSDVQNNQNDRAEFRRRAGELQEQLPRAADERRGALNVALADLWTEHVWSNRSAVRQAVLGSPLISLPGAPPPRGVVPVYSARGSGCAACHAMVATPGFEGYPEPFRTHVQLSSYVGADSPHPPSRMGCAVCHEGNDSGESFTEAGHSTLRVRVRAGEWKEALSNGVDLRRLALDDGQWTDTRSHGAMLPLGRVDAGCARCHAGERIQPGAVTRNDALTSMDRAGCYSCHSVPGLEGLPKRGPDLRRIGGKLTPQWTRRWIAEPSAIKAATWMPRFWRSVQVLQSDDRAEVDAVVAYLFANAESYAPAAPNPPHGDATRGERLVAAVGCLACHVVDATDRDSTSLARTFGPPLQGIGSKTTYAWLYDWIRDPQRFSPGTRMPRLRLSDAEAADVASYLASLTNDQLDQSAPEKTEPAPYQDVVRRYVALGAAAPRDLQGLQLDAAKQAAGKAVIEVRGCFNCHEIRGFEGRRTRAEIADVDGESNHLFHRPPAVRPPGLIGCCPGGYQANTDDELSRPSYPLAVAEWERTTLGAAIAAHQQPDDRRITVPWHVAKTSGRALLQRYNCVGCHVADGTGGDVAAVLPEQAGRAPSLDTVGSRRTVAQLRAYLREPTPSSQGASLRMPTFGLTDDETAAISGYVQAIAPARPAASTAPGAGVAPASRATGPATSQAGVQPRTLRR